MSKPQTHIAPGASRVLALAVGLVAWASSGFGTLSQEATAPVRLNYQQRSIADLAEQYAGRVIELETPRAPFLRVNPPDDEDGFVWMAALSDAVLRVEVASRVARVNEGEPGSIILAGTWILTDVGARILEVLKETERDFSAGQDIVFREDGGELVIGDTTIRGVVRWAHPLETGTEYLLFARVRPGGEMVVGFGGTYERIANDSLRNLLRGGAVHQSSEPPEDVLARIRAAIR